MGVRIRFSKQTLQILDALLVRPGQWQHGYAVSKDTGIASGTLYPILMRLEKLGWLETRWEETRVAGRPPRHQYRLTPNGREWASEEMQAAKTSKFGKLAAREAHG
jgi:PadR family transcriptional regulator PadR